MIEVTEAATYDLASIDNATAAIWSANQADKYQAFLRETLARLENDSALRQPIAAYDGLFVFVAKYSGRRNAHGHRIFYREIEGGIRVIRILHTAMNWTEILEPDDP